MLPNAEANNENLPKLMNISLQDNVIYEDFGGKSKQPLKNGMRSSI